MNKRIFGNNTWVTNDDLFSGFNNNDLIVGGSGCGKTGSYVIPNICEAYGNMIVTDTKSQLHKKLSPHLKQSGYTVHVLDFVNPERSVAYNPLHYIRKNHGKYNEKDIVSLARALVPMMDQDEPFWENSARTVVTFLIAFTLEAMDESEHSMLTLCELYKILLNDSSEMEQWLYDHPDSFALRKYNALKGVMNVERTWHCIGQFVAEALDPFDFKEMENIFGNHNHEEFKISNLWKQKEVVFLNISDTDRYADRMANIFYTQAMQQLCLYADELDDGRLKRPVRFILDDFAANAYIEDFDKLISVIRSRNISCSIIVQSLTQLESMYSKTQANTIITNCDHILYLGGQDIETAKYIGNRCDKTEDTILQMKTGQAYLIERGSIGKLIERIPPYKRLQSKRKEHLAEDAILTE